MNPVSLNITLRDLIDQCDEGDVIAALDRKANSTDGPTTQERYSAVIDELWHLPPTKPGLPIFLDHHWDEDYVTYIDVALWNTAWTPAPPGGDPHCEAHSQVLGMGLTPWSELIDAAIYVSDLDVIHDLCPTLPDVLAEVLWELTFYGWSDADVQATREGIVKSMDEYRKDHDELPRHLADGDEREPA